MKGKISTLLVFILLFSFTMTAYADITDITDITDFEKLREYIKNSKGQSDFISKEDKTYFRHKYWETVLPDYSEARYEGKPISINHDSVDIFKIFVYGEASMIPDNTADKSGHVNYIGYTADGEKVVNLNVNEDKMKNPKLVPIDKYNNPSVKYYGNVRPFRTDYTDFMKVGEMYLGEEASDKDKEAYGRAVVTEWMKNMRVRETGFRDDLIGQGFDKVFSSVDEFVKYVTITSPPTSRSNGQATIWFEHDAGEYYNPETGKYATRRTFLIQQTDPINFKATEYTWNEETKMLNVKYEIEGIEKVDGIVEHVITQDLFPYEYGNFTTSKVKGFPEYFKDEYKEHNGEYIYLSLHDGNKWNVGIIEHRGGDMWDYFTLETQQIKPALENGKIKRNYEVNFNLGYLADYREEDIELDVRANLFTGDVHTGKDALGGDALGFPEYHDGAFYDNHIKVIIPATRLDFDLKHEDEEESRVFKIKDGVDAKIPVVAKLYNLEIEEGIESVVTNINLYDEKGNWIDTLDDLEFHKDGLEDGVVIQDIIIELKKEDLKPRKNVFYAVINSDFDLTEATPLEKEKFLENNKIEIILDVGNVDFEIYPDKALVRHDISDPSDVYLEFMVNLTGTDKPIDTIVDLYKDGRKIDSKSITVRGNNSINTGFNISTKDLDEGVHHYYGVVNANFDLTEARPYKEEIYLENNKTSITVLMEDKEEKSGPCEFKGGSTENTFGLWECVAWNDDGGCVRRDCVIYSVGTTNSAELEYIEYEMGSNIYRADEPGQKYGREKGVPKGKDLNGKPAYDELMARIGYNPLYQVIQTGRGMQVKGVIQLTGRVQEFSEAKADKLIKDFVEDIKRNIYAGSDAKNNEGKEYQGMIEDKSRSGVYIVDLVKKEKFGEDPCKIIYRYTKEFHVEIPIIIDKATGTIDVLNMSPKPKVPDENKYFVYMNTQNGVYQMKIRTDINPRMLGVNQDITKCIIEPDEFKFAVYGSMFDLINTGGDDEDPFWDN